MTIGEFIKRERQRRGMRQKDLAAAAGVSEAYVCRLEKGFGEDPGYYRIKRLVVALGFTMCQAAMAMDEEETEVACCQLQAA